MINVVEPICSIIEYWEVVKLPHWVKNYSKMGSYRSFSHPLLF